MLTPLDIQNRNFSSKIRGYHKEEVDKFIEELYENYQKLYRENIDLKDKISLLNESVQHYRKIEDTLHNTLIIAEKTAEETRKNAYDKAENIVRQAENKAHEIIQTENEKILSKKKEFEELRQQYEIYKFKFVNLLKSELDIIENLNMEDKFNQEDNLILEKVDE